jgi:hypothetical protein
LPYYKDSTTRSDAVSGVIDEDDDSTVPPGVQVETCQDNPRLPRRLAPIQRARSRAESLRSVTFSVDNNEVPADTTLSGTQHVPKTPSPLIRPKPSPKVPPSEVEISLGSPLTRGRTWSNPHAVQESSRPARNLSSPKLTATVSPGTPNRRPVAPSSVATSARKSSLHSVM